MATIREEIDGIKENIATVSKISAELVKEEFKRKIFSLWCAVICLIILCVLSNALWAHYAAQFEKVVETTETVTTTTFEGVEQTADNGGNNTIVGGDLTYGYANAD